MSYIRTTLAPALPDRQIIKFNPNFFLPAINTHILLFISLSYNTHLFIYFFFLLVLSAFRCNIFIIPFIDGIANLIDDRCLKKKVKWEANETLGPTDPRNCICNG